MDDSTDTVPMIFILSNLVSIEKSSIVGKHLVFKTPEKNEENLDSEKSYFTIRIKE